MTILANDFARQWAETADDARAAFEAVGSSGWYILGREVTRFEGEIARFWGQDHAVGVASGLDALEISLRALGCGPGDRVLTSPISAFATTLAILRLGAVPVFADCDETGLVDLAECRKILAQDASIRYFLPVHLYGQALDGVELLRLKNDFRLQIVEDCAQSVGAASRGVPTGSVGAAAATSFYPTKNLGAWGDGGAVLTSDQALAERIRVLRDYGQSRKYCHSVVGYNSRLDELQAAILLRAQLPRLPQWIAARRAVAAAYRNGIQNPAIGIVPEPAGSESCCHLFPVLVAPDLKQEALEYLRQQGVAAGEHYPTPQNEQPALAGLEWSGETPRAARFCRSEISLPIHPYLAPGQVQAVIDVCNQWRP